MRKDFGPKSWLYPMPVLIIAAYDEQGRPNAMNAAWGGIFTDDTIGICVSKGHRITQNILHTKAFTVSMGTADAVRSCDYAGIVSGNREPDKFSKAGFHATRSGHVDAPLIDELPLALECELLSYDGQDSERVRRREHTHGRPHRPRETPPDKFRPSEQRLPGTRRESRGRVLLRQGTRIGDKQTTSNNPIIL